MSASSRAAVNGRGLIATEAAAALLASLFAAEPVSAAPRAAASPLTETGVSVVEAPHLQPVPHPLDIDVDERAVVSQTAASPGRGSGPSLAVDAVDSSAITGVHWPQHFRR